jgi:hypothetical protein
MITEASQEFSGAVLAGAELTSEVARLRKARRNATIAFAMTGTFVGVLFGAAVAAAAGQAEWWAPGSGYFAAVNASVQTLNSPASTGAETASALQANENRKVSATPPVNLEQSSVPKAPQASAPTVPHKSVTSRHSVGGQKAALHRLALDSSTPAPAMAMVVEHMAVAATEAATPSAFVVEGDATVADYDASAGSIETRDGRTFILGGASGAGNSVQWQDYVGNVHYSCTQHGNCTLFRAGVAVPNARLTI